MCPCVLFDRPLTGVEDRWAKVSSGSASAGQALDLTAGKLPLNLSRRIAAVHGRQWSTLCGHSPRLPEAATQLGTG